jgi:hypothetical protein
MSDKLWLLEMFYCDTSHPVGIFSDKDIAERWASEHALDVAKHLYGQPEALDWQVRAYVVNAPDSSWTRSTGGF